MLFLVLDPPLIDKEVEVFIRESDRRECPRTVKPGPVGVATA